MANTFKFVGKIVPCKETAEFKPFNTVSLSGGWKKKTGKFNIVCGSNRHLLTVDYLEPSDITKSVIKFYSKEEEQMVSIPFKDRFTEESLDRCPIWQKYVVDLEFPNVRRNLENALERFKAGKETEEDKQKYTNIDTCQQMLSKSQAKRKEFICGYDFIDYVNKLVHSDKIADMTFNISGNYEITGYNATTNRYYTNLIPMKIYRANNDADVCSEINLDVIFESENALDNSMFNETKISKVTGYIGNYYSSMKKNIYMPISLTIDGNTDEKRAKGLQRIFSYVSEAKYREVGINCLFLNGSQKVEISEKDLTPEQKENLEYGLITMDDIRREMNKDIMGEKITDFVCLKLGKNFSGGAKDTVYTDTDIKNLISSKSSANDTDESNNDDDELNDLVDIFSDDEI